MSSADDRGDVFAEVVVLRRRGHGTAGSWWSGCREGHRPTTIWVLELSLKRFGWAVGDSSAARSGTMVARDPVRRSEPARTRGAPRRGQADPRSLTEATVATTSVSAPSTRRPSGRGRGRSRPSAGGSRSAPRRRRAGCRRRGRRRGAARRGACRSRGAGSGRRPRRRAACGAGWMSRVRAWPSRPEGARRPRGDEDAAVGADLCEAGELPEVSRGFAAWTDVRARRG